MPGFALAFAGLTMQLPPAPDTPPPCVGWNVVFFDTESAELTRQAAMILENFAELLRQSAFPSRVRLTGHADRAGPPAANLRLSRRRAEAVADFLDARGVLPGRITIVADGEVRPIVETADGVAEAQNRNVVVEELVDPAEMARREAIWERAGWPRVVC